MGDHIYLGHVGQLCRARCGLYVQERYLVCLLRVAAIAMFHGLLKHVYSGSANKSTEYKLGH
jgi:hypothetical protein